MKYIINSLLDTDFYKFTMGQLVFHRYPRVPVKYSLIIRTPEAAMADHVKEQDLKKQLDHVRELRFNNSDLHYLRGTNEYSERMFKEDYLQFLKNFALPEYMVRKNGNSYAIDFTGVWSEAIYWETFALSIVNELYFRSLLDQKSDFGHDLVNAEGKLRHGEKIRILKQNPGILFCDFGTRRRFSRAWHDYIIKSLSAELPNSQFLGTSNVYLAMKYGLLPMGTSAHEMPMVMSCIMNRDDDEIRRSQQKVLEDWWEEYGWGLSIFLPDTFGTDFFMKIVSKKQAQEWKGLRQDSGDPFEIGEKAIGWYKSLGIDPTTKLIIFSDGLDMDTILRLYERFKGRIKLSFGWGTNLTNDLGFKALSMVVKVTEANGCRTVKLSDNISKATGNPEDIERFKRIFSYSTNFNKPCTY